MNLQKSLDLRVRVLFLSRLLPLMSILFSRHPLNRPLKLSLSARLSQYLEIIVNYHIYKLLNYRYCRGALLGMKYAKNSKLDSDALILGNGPSLSKLNLSKLADLRVGNKLDVYVVNFALVNDGIPPELVDYLVLSDEGTMPDSRLPQSISLWNLLDQYREIKLVTPDSWHFRFPQLSCGGGTCLHFNDNSLEGVRKSSNPLKPRGYSSMTAYKAMAVSNHCGYKRKLILGLDNTWFRGLSVDARNHMYQESVHFISGYHSVQNISNQFENGVSDYFFEIFKAFQSLNENFKDLDFVNLDQDSLLDCFPKIEKGDPQYLLLKP